MFEFVIFLENKKLFFNFCKILSKILNSNSLILLEGNLGSGKTYLIRNIIMSLFGTCYFVKSPTYGIINIYMKNSSYIYHLDFYKLSSYKDFENIGVSNFINKGLIMIEWSNKYVDKLFMFDIFIYLYDYTKNTRVLFLKTKYLFLKNVFYNFFV